MSLIEKYSNLPNNSNNEHRLPQIQHNDLLVRHRQLQNEFTVLKSKINPFMKRCREYFNVKSTQQLKIHAKIKFRL